MRDDARASEQTEERELIRRSQGGDRAAFNALVTRYQGIAYALAVRMLGEPEAAADVTQEAFLSAFRHLGAFRGASFRAWLLRIVSNGCLDVFRARARHPTTSLDALTDAGEGALAGGPPDDGRLPALLMDAAWDPERAALRRETIASIEAALLCLPAEQRLAVILSDVQGLPYEEIARVMETPVGTVKSRIARARAHLRALLDARGELSASRERHIMGGDDEK